MADVHAKTIKKLMIDADQTPASLARICGRTPRFIRYLLAAERRSQRCEPLVAKALGVDPARLSRLLRG